MVPGSMLLGRNAMLSFDSEAAMEQFLCENPQLIWDFFSNNINSECSDESVIVKPHTVCRQFRTKNFGIMDMVVKSMEFMVSQKVHRPRLDIFELKRGSQIKIDHITQCFRYMTWHRTRYGRNGNVHLVYSEKPDIKNIAYLASSIEGFTISYFDISVSGLSIVNLIHDYIYEPSSFTRDYAEVCDEGTKYKIECMAG